MTTPREQLAKLVFFASHPASKTEWLEQDWNDLGIAGVARYEHLADAIIAAGWTPPPPATNNTHTNN